MGIDRFRNLPEIIASPEEEWLFEKDLLVVSTAEGHSKYWNLRKAEGCFETPVLVSSANPTVKEAEFNGLTRPYQIAAIKLLQHLCKRPNYDQMARNLYETELRRRIESGDVPPINNLAEKVENAFNGQEWRRMYFIATDVRTVTEHPDHGGHLELHQPGGQRSYRSLVELVQGYATTNGNKIVEAMDAIRIQAEVGVALAEVQWRRRGQDVEVNSILGVAGDVVKYFQFKPFEPGEIEAYVRDNEPLVRRVNGGMAWDRLGGNIRLIDDVEVGSDDYRQAYGHLMAMLGGAPPIIAPVVDHFDQVPWNGLSKGFTAEIAATASQHMRLRNCDIGMWHPLNTQSGAMQANCRVKPA
jgi:hypothetical protein